MMFFGSDSHCANGLVIEVAGDRQKRAFFPQVRIPNSDLISLPLSCTPCCECKPLWVT